MQVLILGCGDIGTRVGLSLLERDWRVAAARRNPDRLPDQFDRHKVNLTEQASWDQLDTVAPDYVVVTPTPQSYDPAGYQAGFAVVAKTLASQKWIAQCRRVIWVSSTRVYRESEGGWVDEHSPLNLDEAQAGSMIAGEAAIRRAATATIIRPAGVYGDPEGMLMRRVQAGEGGATDALYGNRIHREDLSRLIAHCLERDHAGQSVPPTMVGADHDQAPTHEIEDWLADQIGVTLNRPSDPSPPRAHRRCRNSLLERIGFTLSYPTWCEGYRAALDALAQR
jgi:nucleoside-diphosphate-sugar epimerase